MDHPNKSGRLNRVERWIQWLLWVVGGVEVLAFVAIFLPRDLMVSVHQSLGLGNAPDQAIFGYLARSLSLLYFAHGTVVLALTTDVRRYWPIIKLMAWLNLLIGLILLGIDWFESMPWWWTLGEGPAIIAGAILLLVLIRMNDRKVTSDQ
jgi:uncharacterized membrane protein YhaH (DUF805 family)